MNDAALRVLVENELAVHFGRRCRIAHLARRPSLGRRFCFVAIEMTPEGYVVSEELTQPTDGIFNCNDANLSSVGG